MSGRRGDACRNAGEAWPSRTSPAIDRELRRDFLLDGNEPGPVARLSAPCPPDSPRPVPCAIAIGVFDGLHEGHRHLLRRTVADARSRGVDAVAVTFDPDPDTVVCAKPSPKLLSVDDRLHALAHSGVDAVAVVPFTRELAGLDHTAFFEDVLAPHLAIESVHVGSDFRLGAGGASTLDVIAAWGRERGIEVVGHHLVRDGGATVSATRIRALLAEGALDAAFRELGRRYLVRGEVVHGRGEGALMGFPTANVAHAPELQMPAVGVYAGWALTEEGSAYPAAVNVGLPPMFKDDVRSATLEATLLGFSGDLYGQELAVVFAERLRPPASFSSRDELIAAVRGNMEDVRRRFGDEAVRLGGIGEVRR